MIDISIFFKVNSETDINRLVELNNTVVSRIRALQHLSRTPIVVPEPVEEVRIIKEIPVVKEEIKNEKQSDTQTSQQENSQKETVISKEV